MTSLRLRLLLAAGVFIAVATVLAAFGLTLLFQRHVTDWADAELSAHMDQLIAGIDASPEGVPVVARAPSDARFARPLSGLYWEVVIDPSGPTYRSRSLWDFEIALPQEAKADDDVRHHRVAGPGGSALYLVQRRIELPERLQNRTARVAIALDAAQLNAAVHRFTTTITPYLALLAGLLLVATWAQVTLGLRPLAAVRDKLAAVAEGRKPRLGSGFPAEVQPLVDEFDTLLAARERQIEKARTRAADLAHGLKTPLQVLQADIRRLEGKGETDIAADIAKVSTAMQRHVDRELAKARRVASHAGANANVASVTDGVVRVVQRSPDGERVTWDAELPPDLNARIDPADLAEAIGNLVENAARHAHSLVRVTAARVDAGVEIRIADDGPGIPVARRAEAIARGRRLDTASSGEAGLGLAIVSDIAETWQGELVMSDETGAAPGGRPMFAIALILPAAAARI